MSRIRWGFWCSSHAIVASDNARFPDPGIGDITASPSTYESKPLIRISVRIARSGFAVEYRQEHTGKDGEIRQTKREPGRDYSG